MDKLATYVAFLGDDPDRWRSRLVGLHVMDRSMLPVGADVDQKVQLVQASATTRTLLDPERSTPDGEAHRHAVQPLRSVLQGFVAGQ